MTDWTPLRQALQNLRAAHMPLPIWWRDDDAIEVTANLDQLNELSVKTSVPVHVAVIPDLANLTLPPYIQQRPNLIPLVHGWRHENRAPEGAKKAEFGHPRPDALANACQALARMEALFGPELLPIFVPPWNRLDPALAQQLPDLGYVALSTFGARATANSVPFVNTHIDPIYWRGHRGLIDPQVLISQTVTHLNARLSGAEDPCEPFGYLTHHLVHTPDIWAFSERFLVELLDGGAQIADLKKDIP